MSSSSSKRNGVKIRGIERGNNGGDDDLSIRKGRLDLVYSKAVDVSINAINDENLKECFGEVKDKLGNALQKSFLNMLGETSTAMEAAYKSACIKCDLDERLHALESMPVTSYMEYGQDGKSHQDENTMHVTLLDIKSQELYNLQSAIIQIENEINQVKEALEKSRHELGNSIAAFMDETDKMASAAGQTPP